SETEENAIRLVPSLLWIFFIPGLGQYMMDPIQGYWGNVMSKCVFCEIAEGRLEPDAKVYENESVIAFFDRGAIAPYHTLVVPKRHSTNIFDIHEDDLIAVTRAIKHICLMYKERLGIADIQIVSSNGKEAQQDAFHTHFHVVPRHKGDGQDIVWTPDPTLSAKNEEFLARLNGT
ncbi:HIT family protein, partial [Pseudovibrio sp. WM33]|uniref:HIT family protein n=1 Tax=Pseudovibrio sp. WM33 TaxID=1735585 RepID=UPI001FCCADC0